jgi:hypothetical protein
MRQILLFGGVVKGGKVTNELLMFDTGMMGWTMMPMPGAPSARYGHSAVMCGDRLVIHGGRDDKNIFGDISFFDMATLQWRKGVATGLPPRYSHCAFPTANSIVVLGGAANDSVGPPAMTINPADWSCREHPSAGNVPLGLIKFAFDVSDEGVLVFGGCEAGTRMGWNAMFMVTLPDDIALSAVRGRAGDVGARRGRGGRKTMRVQGGERPFVPMGDEEPADGGASVRAVTTVGSARPKMDGSTPEGGDTLEVRGRTSNARQSLGGTAVIRFRKMRGQHLDEGDETIEQLRSSIALSLEQVPKDDA